MRHLYLGVGLVGSSHRVDQIVGRVQVESKRGQINPVLDDRELCRRVIDLVLEPLQAVLTTEVLVADVLVVLQVLVHFWFGLFNFAVICFMLWLVLMIY